eukprot:gene27621-7259_t
MQHLYSTAALLELALPLSPSSMNQATLRCLSGGSPWKEGDLRGVQVLMKEINVGTVKASEIEACDFPFHLEMKDSCCQASGKPDCLTCWFDVRFPNSESGPAEEAVVLNTVPAAEHTHLGQQTFLPPPKALDLVETSIPASLRVFQLPTTHQMYGVLLPVLPSVPPSELDGGKQP